MFKLTYAHNIWGSKFAVKAGYPEHQVPDLLFYNCNSPSHFTEINSTVLKDSLLNSKEVLETLGLVVMTTEELNKLTESHKPPFNVEEEKAPEVADAGVPAPEPQEQTPLQTEKEFTVEEKKVLNKATKAFAEEHGCSLKEAKAYIAEHIDEYLPKEKS